MRKTSISFFDLLGDCSHLACTTANGPDPGKSCVFPFIIGNHNFSCCTAAYTIGQWHNEPLCATMVDESGVFMASRWGYCEQECYPDGLTPGKSIILQ